MSEGSLYNVLGFADSLGMSVEGRAIGNKAYEECRFSIAMGIDDLIDASYTKDEIVDIIKKIDFTIKYPMLTNDDVDSLRIEALDILERKYGHYLEQISELRIVRKREDKKD